MPDTRKVYLLEIDANLLSDQITACGTLQKDLDQKSSLWGDLEGVVNLLLEISVQHADK